MTEEIKKAIDAEDYEAAALLRDGKISYYNAVDYTDRLFLRYKTDYDRLLLYENEYNNIDKKTIFLKDTYFEVIQKKIIDVKMTKKIKMYEVYVNLKKKTKR